MAAEIAAMNDACDFLAAADFLDRYAVGFCLQDQSVHGMALGRGQLADVVGRQRKHVALPIRDQCLAVRRQFAANPVRIGRKEGRAQPVTQISELVIVNVEHLLGAGQVG